MDVEVFQPTSEEKAIEYLKVRLIAAEKKLGRRRELIDEGLIKDASGRVIRDAFVLDGWNPPSGIPLRRSVVEILASSVFEDGWSRSNWCGGPAPRCSRREYEDVIDLFQHVGVIVDRRPGAGGRLAVETHEDVLRILKLGGKN